MILVGLAFVVMSVVTIMHLMASYSNALDKLTTVYLLIGLALMLYDITSPCKVDTRYFKTDKPDLYGLYIVSNDTTRITIKEVKRYATRRWCIAHNHTDYYIILNK